MALRWYTIVVDCHDIRAQAEWWADVLGWRKIYEADDEVVIIPPRLADEAPGTTPWDQVPPGLHPGLPPLLPPRRAHRRARLSR